MLKTRTSVRENRSSFHGAVLPPQGKGQMDYDTPQGNERYRLEIRARVGPNPTAPLSV